MDLTHVSFFSGVGGLDLGLERAGWRTVSFSEIDPYASAVLAQRWPGVPNFGDIVRLDWRDEDDGERSPDAASREWCRATLWSGGFPCQDLSVAGKRRGLAGARSGLAWTFLALVERYRPPAILLENVPGLLSSHRGRDFYALQRAMAELGYVGAYRILDARHFGVPQRRRRVFIVALRADLDPTGERAAEVLSVGSRCGRHPPAGTEAWEGTAGGAVAGVDIARAVTGTSGKRHDDDTDTLISASPDPRGVRAPDGMAGGMDDSGVAATLNSGGNSGGFRTEPGEHLVPTLRVGGRGDGAGSSYDNTPWGDYPASQADDPLLPIGLDSHRYRCCGNGVVSSVAEWVGLRLAEALA